MADQYMLLRRCVFFLLFSELFRVQDEIFEQKSKVVRDTAITFSPASRFFRDPPSTWHTAIDMRRWSFFRSPSSRVGYIFVLYVLCTLSWGPFVVVAVMDLL